ncbi:MAG: hypothetical protein PWQ40_1892 [Archaeoglobus sp.]|nr:hypothetical protein [Archaeoglobus sp.]
MSAGRLGKIGLVAMIILLTIITINTSAAPLEVSIEERVNSTINMTDAANGVGTFEYQTDVKGIINVTNNANEDIMDIWVAVDIGLNDGSCSAISTGVQILDSGDVPSKLTNEGGFDTSGADCIIHIPRLGPGESKYVAYDVTETPEIQNGAPFIVEEKYDPAKIPKGGDYTWTVYFNVSLNDTWWSSTGLGGKPSSVTLTVNKNLNTSYGWDSLEFVSGGSQCSSGQQSCSFSGSLSSSPTQTTINETFKVKGNYSTDEAFVSRLVGFGEAVLSFGQINGNISGTKIIDVFAIGNASIGVNKSGPFGPSENQWKGNVTIKNTASGLTYVVKSVNVWATDRTNYQEIDNSRLEENPNKQIAAGESYTSGDTTFTSTTVPIIWGNVTFRLVEDANYGWGVGQDKITDGGNTYIIERIYVIGSYLVKVTKHVESAGNDIYNITLVVENLGGQESPYVYVYDLIPKNFSLTNGDNDWKDPQDRDGDWVNKSSMLAGGPETITNIQLSGYDTGYWWRIRPINASADGDGAYDDYTEIENNQTVVIFYQIQGSEDYKLLDAFIVGIDPILSMNEQTSPKITLVSGAKATSYESVMALATALVGLTAVVGYRRRS